MACPAASSSINMLGIARENIYDDYSSASTPTAPYAIFDLVVGGDDGGSGQEMDDKNDAGGYGGAGDPPGNEVSFSHFWGYDHDAAGTQWTTTPADFTLTAESGTANSGNQQWALSNGSGNTTVTFVKVSGDNMIVPQFAAGTSSSPSNWTHTGSTITISHTTGNFYVRVRHDYDFRFLNNSGVYRITVTNNSVSDTCDATLRILGL